MLSIALRNVIHTSWDLLRILCTLQFSVTTTFILPKFGASVSHTIDSIPNVNWVTTGSTWCLKTLRWKCSQILTWLKLLNWHDCSFVLVAGSQVEKSKILLTFVELCCSPVSTEVCGHRFFHFVGYVLTTMLFIAIDFGLTPSSL